MISADDALSIVLDSVAPLGVERVPILAALGECWQRRFVLHETYRL